MKSVNESGRSQKLIVKKSIFICTIYKVSNKEEAVQFLAKVKTEFRNATHNAYAYRVRTSILWEESSDDGEVKGCAGKPIIDLLRKQNLTNLLVIVTRFYGGIKFGPGRLIRNYSKSVNDLIGIIGLEEL
ncbi:MAG: YigZ family protein [Candidatus Heimdallarchaeota archaeon]